ncbi:hypothetical protein [Listeria booriae]|uniref:hypothetical protein n=1 Tax=Listeria booriae TaxID=1552123 RepID=UPI001E4223D4|nr:hypothetical protein [Listeria booriae]MCD2208583.1 hypothetical protein [Listeria booriae]
MMEIKVTGVPVMVAKAITLQAGSQSRESYLRDYFEREAIAPEVTRKEMEYEALIIRLLHFINCNNKEWLQLFALMEPNWKNELEGGISKDDEVREDNDSGTT